MSEQPKTKEAEILFTKRIRINADKVLQDAKEAPPSREMSLCITKLQEAIMWAGMNLKRLNDGVSCYPNGYKENTIVDPMEPPVKL